MVAWIYFKMPQKKKINVSAMNKSKSGQPAHFCLLQHELIKSQRWNHRSCPWTDRQAKERWHTAKSHLQEKMMGPKHYVKCSEPDLKPQQALGLVAHAFNPTIQMAEAGWFLWVWGQSHLHSEFRDGQSYVERTCLKNPKTKPNKQTKNMACFILCMEAKFKIMCTRLSVCVYWPIFLGHRVENRITRRKTS